MLIQYMASNDLASGVRFSTQSSKDGSSLTIGWSLAISGRMARTVTQVGNAKSFLKLIAAFIYFERIVTTCVCDCFERLALATRTVRYIRVVGVECDLALPPTTAPITPKNGVGSHGSLYVNRMPAPLTRRTMKTLEQKRNQNDKSNEQSYGNSFARLPASFRKMTKHKCVSSPWPFFVRVIHGVLEIFKAVRTPHVLKFMPLRSRANNLLKKRRRLSVHYRIDEIRSNVFNRRREVSVWHYFS